MKKVIARPIIGNDQAAPTAPTPLMLRLGEILHGSRDLLATVGTAHFNDFALRYSLNVRDGLQLLRRFKPLYEPATCNTITQCAEVLALCFSPDDHSNLLNEGKLSIVDQLLQIIARWQVHHWLVNAENTAFVHWLGLHRDVYPLLLAKMKLNDVVLPKATQPVTVPDVEITRLMDLVSDYLHQGQLNNMAAALSAPGVHDIVMAFSAQREQINKLKILLPHITSMLKSNALQFFHENRGFFVCLYNNSGFNESFVQYCNASVEARAILLAIRGCGNTLKDLLTLDSQNGLSEVINNREYSEHFRPIMNYLLAGYLDGRLQMLVDISTVTKRSTPEKQQELNALTWLESHRDVIGLSFQPNNDWQQWLMGQDTHRVNMQLFSMGLSEQLEKGLRVSDVVLDSSRSSYQQVVDCVPADIRPGKLQVFPSPTVCFAMALNPTQRAADNNYVGCLANDVLLADFLKHPNNFGLVDFINRHSQRVEEVIVAFRAHQAVQVNQQIIQPLVNLDDNADQNPVQVEFVPHHDLRAAPTKPKRLIFQPAGQENDAGEYYDERSGLVI